MDVAPSTAAAVAPDQQFRDSLLARHGSQRRGVLRSRLLWGLGTTILLLCVWEAVVRSGWVDRAYFPPPSDVFVELARTVADGERGVALLRDIGVTVKNAAIGFGMGSALGIALGVVMGAWLPAYYGFSPLVYITFPMPKVTLYPLFIVILGLSQFTIQAVCALSTFYVVCIAAADGVRSSPVIHREMASVFKVPRRVRYQKVVIPAALPAIVNGLRLGSGVSLVLVLIIEFIGSMTGVGAYIWSASQAGAVDRMFVALIVVTILGGALFILGDRAERWASPWASREGVE